MSCEDDLIRAQAALRQEQGDAAALVQERTFVTAERTRLRQEADRVNAQAPDFVRAAYNAASPYSEEGRQARDLPQSDLIELIRAAAGTSGGGAETGGQAAAMSPVIVVARVLAQLQERLARLEARA